MSIINNQGVPSKQAIFNIINSMFIQHEQPMYSCICMGAVGTTMNLKVVILGIRGRGIYKKWYRKYASHDYCIHTAYIFIGSLLHV